MQYRVLYIMYYFIYMYIKIIFFHLDFDWVPTTPWYFIVSLFRYWLHISIFHLVHSMSSMVSGSLDPLVSGSTRRTRMPARNELGRNKLFWINLKEQKNGFWTSYLSQWIATYLLGASEISANLYCNCVHPYWKVWQICSYGNTWNALYVQYYVPATEKFWMHPFVKMLFEKWGSGS